MAHVARRRRGAGRARVVDGRRLLGLRLPQGPRRRLRPAGLPVDLAARPLRARVPVLAARRAADGLLPARRPRPRGPAPRHRGPARPTSTPARSAAPSSTSRRRSCPSARARRASRPCVDRARVARAAHAAARALGRRARSRGRPPRASATSSACAATRSPRSSPPARPAVPSARSTTSRRARAPVVRRSAQLAWSGACDALAGRAPAGAVAPGRRGARPRGGRGGTQLSLGLELPAAPALRRARRLGRDDRRLRDDRPHRRSPPAAPAARGPDRARDRLQRGSRPTCPTARTVRVGGIVVARQRPGTAKGVVFLLLEDETGTVNVIVPPKVYERDRLTVRTEPLVVVEGVLERFASAGGRHQPARPPPRARSTRPTCSPAARARGQGLLDARRARARADRTGAAARGRGGGRRRDGRPRAPGRASAAPAAAPSRAVRRHPPRGRPPRPRRRPAHASVSTAPRADRARRRPTRPSRCPRAAPGPRTSGPWPRRS